MQFLLGALSTVGFFGCLGLAYMAGRRSKPSASKNSDAKAPGANEEERQKAASLRKGFLDLMNYDVEQARKRVT